jgi:hypothetical protein
VEIAMEAPQRLKVELPHVPATPLPGIYWKEPINIHIIEAPAHHVYCSTIHNSQVLDSDYLLINR